ncbi:YbaL family putative K(+) efflux transporter [Altererythrobacter sp. Root672]|uniref:YbaL family putative K(+) efflux transporter n=1 Tax=Altererythrobacter sp. Root672 TaxID=1736584 RepID=UPI0006F60E22|nr:YbaL family putative K(+) efflux transporter [Altererythrobacter sp. Root672]KRA83923.1 cation:proton antiport protein [Altererythrobacter sp. Root672]
MPHHTPLIGTIVAGLVVAFFMGALAHRLRVSPVAGYLFAGVIVGPFTPGFVADTGLANELAELGVILLMFGVGLHFSLRDLLSVRRIAIPGALTQIAVATLLGLALALALGWSILSGLVFGLALSVASTVVLLRAMQARDLINTERGRIAVGWLIVEDLAMVLTLVLLPPIARMVTADSMDGAAIATTFGITVLKVGGFIAFMLIVARRLIPAALHWVAHTGSRELFRLAVLAIALGVAFGAAYVFDVSFALGAFFAGMILGESQLSRRAAEETLPLRDAFAVLFFVSVGMLFDPAVVVEQPWPLLATVAIIILGKSIAAFAIVRFFGHPTGTALTISASLAQIGEFSFILAGLGTNLGILPPEGRDLILAGAILSIFANPFVFTAVAGRVSAAKKAAVAEAREVERQRQEDRREHTLLIGYGRVGRLVGQGAKKAGRAVVVVEDEADVARAAADDGLPVVIGNAAAASVLEEAGIEDAKRLVIAIPEGFEAGAIAEQARKLNPNITIFARAHSDSEVAYLMQLGVDEVIMGEREIADRLLELMAPKAPVAH